MSKFNTAAVSMKTENHEGFAAYAMNDKEKLVSQVLTSFFNEKKFYGDNSEELVETLKSVIKSDPEFVSNLAVFARREFNMRSVSHVLTGYLANIPEGKPYVKRTLKNVILRGDDATEILAFYLNTFGKPIPNSLRRGLRDVFTTFDAYTLGKYKGEGNAVKMRDILCLCRPKPKDVEQSKTWKDLLEGKLATPYTWETELSAKGNKKEVWEELIDSGKVGYMALLRNLRNILNAEPENVQKVLDRIADPQAVRQSRQLPFRFLSAYRELPVAWDWDQKAAQEALEKAADAAVECLPPIPGKTVIAIDVSGSMGSRISGRSQVCCSDIAVLLGLIADRLCQQSIVFTFDDCVHIPHFASNRNDILYQAMNYRPNGGGTNMYAPLDKMLDEHIIADRLIILSDNECNYSFGGDEENYYPWRSHDKTVQKLADEYRKTINPDFWVHAIDIQGYGTQQFIGGKTNLIAGWSEKVFEFICLAEKGTSSLVKRIDHYIPYRS